MEIKISPSIMCCKVEEYKPYIELFEKVKLDSIHFDIMDGHYVKNVMLGTTVYKDIKRLSNLPVDLHFMAYNPEDYIEYYNVQSGDRISFHPETTAQPYRLLQSIKDKGCLAGLVINPGTPISFIEESIDLIDYVTLMTVNPGFAGQKMVPNAPEKIRRIVELVNGRNIDVFVDGNTTFENSEIMRKAGANGFVVGTSSIMKSIDTFEEEYYKYIKNIEKVEI
ncbi:ribulose-phosphate 3-epimerase [Clostridium tertium]|uniref:D-allulose-6-phosphate 3-epimerase n=1 Tax=Clostridium tertium TaxID=1559 RepID=A0A6N3AWK5_9CLOT